jgi:hypothetical protein
VHPRRDGQGRFALRRGGIGNGEYPNAQSTEEGDKREIFHLKLRVWWSDLLVAETSRRFVKKV